LFFFIFKFPPVFFPSATTKKFPTIFFGGRGVVSL
jgi:hypothetical protein